MTFVFIAIFAYFLLAVAAVIDKVLLHKQRIGDPASYTFVIGILNLAVAVLIPFGFVFPGMEKALLSFVAGVLFIAAVFVYFGVLKKKEASRVLPVLAGFVPFFTLLLASIFLQERLSNSQLIAFGLLVLGSVLIFSPPQQKTGGAFAEILLTIFAAFLFALSLVLTKEIFNDLGFINGLIWTRLGMVLGAVVLLISQDYRTQIFGRLSRVKKGVGHWVLVGQIFGAGGGFLQNYAIALGSVTIVNALQGTQFGFLLVITSLFSLKYSQILKEKLSQKIILQKIIAITLISLGIGILAL